MFVWENEYVSNDTQNNWKKNAYKQNRNLQGQTRTIELHATILFYLGMDNQPIVYLFIIFASFSR